MATSAEPTRKLTLLARARRAIQRAVGGRPGDRSLTRAAIYPPSPFADWEFEDAEEAVAAALAAQTIDTSVNGQMIAPAPNDPRFQNIRRTQDPLVVNRAFYTGDHWQYGSGYIGPHPATTDAAFTEAMTEISSIFTSQNAIREVTDRHSAGVVGKPFRWSFVPRRDTGDQTPTAQEQTAIDEATAIVRNWLTARKVPTMLLNATATLLLAERASVRLYVPAGLATPNGDGTTSVNVAKGDVAAALAKVWPEHPLPDDATVACDDDTKLEAGVFTCEGDDPDSDEDDDAAIDYAWLTFLNRVGDTVIRILSDGGDTPTAEDLAAAAAADATADAPKPGDAILPMGGRIAMFEMHRPALITPQVQQAQRALNFALTMVPRNVTTGGFVERLLLDASVPGTFQTGTDGVKRFVPSSIKLGAGTTNFIEGAEYETTNAQGEKITTRGKPTAIFREPVAPTASITAKDDHHRSILAETGQLHTLISGDATASAVARIQARAEYLNTLLRTKFEVDALLAWLLEAALAMAEAIAETPGKYTKPLRATAQCKLDAGPITPEERKAIEASIGVTVSQETAMLMLDVEDVDAELSRMADDPASRAEYAKEVGIALQALTTAGATLEGAAKFMDLSKEEIDKLLTPETYAALPGGVTVRQPKPGEPGEVIEPQDVLEEPPAALTAPALDAGVPAAPAAKQAAGAKPTSGSGAATGAAASGNGAT